MTNWERWQYLMKDCTSPQLYVDFGFYYTIAAALQRRVWVGPDHDPLFANINVILVGEPGIGKGRVIKPVAKLLKHHKYQPKESLTNELPDEEEEKKDETSEEIQAMIKEIAAQRGIYSAQKKTKEQPLLIPVAADATTYEALVRSLSGATRRINYVNGDGKKKIYTHCSLCFCLEELSSLFRKKTEDTVNFLLHTYDCGDYDYDTKTQGKDSIRRCCVNLLAGTTPNFMQSCFNDALVNEGFSSRTFFIHASRNRKDTLVNPDLNEKQIACQIALLDHIKKLSELFGGVKYTAEAFDWLEEWWKKLRTGVIDSPNRSVKLDAYYSRKNIHAQKLALIIHASERTDLSEPISLETVQFAMKTLDAAEKGMHNALTFESGNKLSKTARKVTKYLMRHGKQMFTELLVEFFDEATSEELRSCIEYLQTTGKVKTIEKQIKGKDVVYYELHH